MLLPFDHDYLIHHGDCVEHMDSMPPESVDFCVYSPPFPSVYSYTSLPEDIGNTEDLRGEAKLHFSYFFRRLIRVMKPGRVMMLHCTQIVRMKRSGGEGAFDFRGLLIRMAERAGFIYEYDWTIRKNPQAQAIRTKSRSLQFAGLESDRAKSRGAMPDFLVKFMTPGVNDVPVDSPGEVSRNQWIDWAESHWTGIAENDTLNKSEGRGEDDVKHIAPLQKEVINRLVKLYSNPGEIVYDPFTGLGTTGYISLLNDRRFYGTEIKPEYFAAANRNCERALQRRKQADSAMFPAFADQQEPSQC